MISARYIPLALLLISSLCAAAGCDQRIGEPRLSQLANEATGPWINGTGLRLRRAEAVKVGGSSLEIVYMQLDGVGNARDVIAAIERGVNNFNAGTSTPLAFRATVVRDVSQGVRDYDSSRQPPSWWPSKPVAGTTISLSSGPQIDIPDTGGSVYVVYACP